MNGPNCSGSDERDKRLLEDQVKGRVEFAAHLLVLTLSQRLDEAVDVV